MKLVTEYLIIIEKNASEALYHLCDNVKEFNKLLQTDADIAIAHNQIKHKNTIDFPYEIKHGNIEGKEQRFFHIKITFNSEEEKIDNYIELLRGIRIIVGGAKGQIETLRDDVSSFFANKSYPLIHDVENLMRKLITYFMLTNVGKEWVTEASPASFKEAIDKSKRKEYVDILHQIDFIQLGDFLFKPYQTRNVSDLYEVLEKAKNIDELDLNELKDFKAKSNWERYFSDIVDCDDAYLNKRWKELYDLRCMVAHNAIIIKNKHERIIELVTEVSEPLQKAIDNLDKVHIPTEEKEQIAENVVGNINALYGEFIKSWKNLEIFLNKVPNEFDKTDRFKPVMTQIKDLYNSDLIDIALLDEASYLSNFRNKLIHGSSSTIDELDISANIARLNNFIRAVKSNITIDKELSGSLKDEVFTALQALNGRAFLADIYTYIEENTKRELPEFWQAGIRRTLQNHSSDTRSYKGGEDLFQHLDRGYWGLRNFNEETSA